MKIFVAIPNIGNIRTELIDFILTLIGGKYKFELFMPQNKPHDHNRNVIVRQFLKTDCTHLLMIDSDVVPSNNLLEMVEHNVDIVSGWVSVYKNGVVIQLAMNKKEHGYTQAKELKMGLNKVDAVGTGCLMIKREVFEKLKHPYFKFVYDDEGMLIKGEDFYFCDKAKEVGLDVYFDTEHKCYHYQTIPTL